MPVLTEDLKRGGVIVPPRPPEASGGDGDANQPSSSFPVSSAQLAIWLVLTGVTMLFAGLTSAYVVLRGVPEWQSIALPSMLWVNTAVLIISSGTLELARLAVRQARLRVVRQWLAFSGLLGIAFLGGQLLVWRQLVDAGIYLPTTLHSSFFYVLTGIHGIHLAGGVIALGFVLYKAFQGQLTTRPEALKLCALYWHFMGLVWVFIFLLLVLA